MATRITTMGKVRECSSSDSKLQGGKHNNNKGKNKTRMTICVCVCAVVRSYL